MLTIYGIMNRKQKAPNPPFKRLIPSTLFLVVFMALAMGGFAQSKRSLSDSEYALCKAKLERAHQGFYRLSYNEQYVRDVIMPGIRTERGTVAPHFPQRVAGQNSDVLFKDWMENYWEEYGAYMHFLNKQHEKWRLALSEN